MWRVLAEGNIGGASSEATSSQVVRALRQLLGTRLVAFIGGAPDVALVADWASGARAPAAAVLERYAVALRAAREIAARDGSDVAQAWFQGLNPALDDRSPATMLREMTRPEDAEAVLDAARQQAAGF